MTYTQPQAECCRSLASRAPSTHDPQPHKVLLMIISMFSPIGVPTVNDESRIAGSHSGFPRPTSSPPSKALPRLRSVALLFQRPDRDMAWSEEAKFFPPEVDSILVDLPPLAWADLCVP
jgi:hypothetical protein